MSNVVLTLDAPLMVQQLRGMMAKSYSGIRESFYQCRTNLAEGYALVILYHVNYSSVTWTDLECHDV